MMLNTNIIDVLAASLFRNIPCDLMSFKSVRSAAEKLQAELGQSGLDVLCNNAGIAFWALNLHPKPLELQTPQLP